MPSTQPSQLHTLRRQVTSLQRRMSLLERAIKPKEREPGPVSSSTAADRRWAEIQARMNAMKEYWELRYLELYRKYPSLLEEDLANEQKKNAFLRERGVSPIDDMVTRIARRLEGESKQ